MAATHQFLSHFFFSFVVFIYWPLLLIYKLLGSLWVGFTHLTSNVGTIRTVQAAGALLSSLESSVLLSYTHLQLLHTFSLSTWAYPLLQETTFAFLDPFLPHIRNPEIVCVHLQQTGLEAPKASAMWKSSSLPWGRHMFLGSLKAVISGPHLTWKPCLNSSSYLATLFYSQLLSSWATF